MAARSKVLHRRDFLRSLGLAAGVSIPELPISETPATPTPAPTPTPTTTPTPSAPSPSTTATASPPTPGATTPAESPDAAPASAAVVPIVASPADRHLLSRFSYGVTQDLLADAADAGTSAWFEDQLDPDSVADGFAGGLKAWWPHLSWTPQEMWNHDQSGDLPGWEQQDDFVRWTLLRRIYSKRQVHETMVEFWSNLLHIPAPLGKCFPHRLGYDATIRQHALGTFEEMLEAAILHPAMLCYLDNAISTFTQVNENLGREVLELHTVGREAGFTEDEVSDSAMILTGWHVDVGQTWVASYHDEDHYTEPVSVLGFESENAQQDGREMSRQYLRYLANHESTARRVAHRLAVRFVRDEPSDELVNYLAGVFTDSGTDIRTTLRALVAHDEFLSSAGGKVRTPTEDTVNTFRVLEVVVTEPTGADSDAAHAILTSTSTMGQRPFDWPRPDGFPDSAEAWSSASRALGSWKIHKNLSKGIYPKTAVEYRPEDYWLLPMPVRFDVLVEHLSQRLLAQPATTQVIRAASKAVEVLADEYVLASGTLVRTRIPDLLIALLDTPQHMMR